MKKTLTEQVQDKIKVIIDGKAQKSKYLRKIDGLEKDIFVIDKTTVVNFERIDSNHCKEAEIRDCHEKAAEITDKVESEKQSLFNLLREYQDVELEISYDGDTKILVVSQVHNPDTEEDETYIRINGVDL